MPSRCRLVSRIRLDPVQGVTAARVKAPDILAADPGMWAVLTALRSASFAAWKEPASGAERGRVGHHAADGPQRPHQVSQ